MPRWHGTGVQGMCVGRGEPLATPADGTVGQPVLPTAERSFGYSTGARECDSKQMANPLVTVRCPILASRRLTELHWVFCGLLKKKKKKMYLFSYLKGKKRERTSPNDLNIWGWARLMPGS